MSDTRTKYIEEPRRIIRGTDPHEVIVSGKGGVSVLRIHYCIPIVETKSPSDAGPAIKRFTPGPEQLELLVLAEHRETRNRGSHLHVLGFVDRDDKYSSIDASNDPTPVNYRLAIDVVGSIPSFEKSMADVAGEALDGRLSDYVLGRTAARNLLHLPATPLTQSIGAVTIDATLKALIERNPGLEPYNGSLDLVFYQDA